MQTLCPSLTQCKHVCAQAEDKVPLTTTALMPIGTPASMAVCAQVESKLVFVPSMSDAGPAAILPRPPLPEPLIAEARELLPNAVFASNPCRIRFYNQVSQRERVASITCLCSGCCLSHDQGADGARLWDLAERLAAGGHCSTSLLLV